MVVTWNETRVPFPEDKCIHHLFEEVALLHPSAAAIILPSSSSGGQPGRTVTYRDMDVYTYRFAALLVDRGVGPDSLVAMVMERSVEMVVAVYGILRAGPPL